MNAKKDSVIRNAPVVPALDLKQTVLISTRRDYLLDPTKSTAPAPILANQKRDLLNDEDSSDDECLRCAVGAGLELCILCVWCENILV